MMNHPSSTMQHDAAAAADTDLADENWTSFAEVNAFRPKPSQIAKNHQKEQKKMNSLMNALFLKRDFQDVNTEKSPPPMLEEISEDDSGSSNSSDDASRPPSVLIQEETMSDTDSLTLSLDTSETSGYRRAERIRNLKDSFYDMVCNSCGPVHHNHKYGVRDD